MKKGITPVIAIILLMLLVIAMVGVAFTWFGRTTTETTGVAEEELRTKLPQEVRRIRILSDPQPDDSVSELVIKNIGNREIPESRLAVYFIDDGIFTGNIEDHSVGELDCVPDNIQADRTATCSWSTPITCNSGDVFRAASPGNYDEVTC